MDLQEYFIGEVWKGIGGQGYIIWALKVSKFLSSRLEEDVSWREYGAKLINKVEERILLQISTLLVGTYSDTRRRIKLIGCVR